MAEDVADVVNHPAHYADAPVECIVFSRRMTFTQGNAFKYLWRAGRKDPSKYKEDLEKAIWYIKDAFANREVWHCAQGPELIPDWDKFYIWFNANYDGPMYCLLVFLMTGDLRNAYSTALELEAQIS